GSPQRIHTNQQQPIACLQEMNHLTLNPAVNLPYTNARNHCCLLWANHRHLRSAGPAPLLNQLIALAGSVNHFIKLDRNFRALSLHSILDREQKVCLRLRPPTKIWAASPVFPLPVVAIAQSDEETKQHAAETSLDLLWKFFQNFSLRLSAAKRSI